MTEVRYARLVDIPYIDHLQRIEANRADSVGFIPWSRYEKEVDHGGIHISLDNNEPTGFVYSTHNRHGVTRIQQVVIQDDARRAERATLLIKAAIRKTDWLVSLRCAEDLEAVGFWPGLGFERVDVDDKPNKRQRKVLKFQKVVGGLWLLE
jgi:N-acetylglutamate synthase-like GNAT family acetyltransferase